MLLHLDLRIPKRPNMPQVKLYHPKVLTVPAFADVEQGLVLVLDHTQKHGENFWLDVLGIEAVNLCNLHRGHIKIPP